MRRGNSVIFIFLACAILAISSQASARVDSDVIQLEQNSLETTASHQTFCLSNSLTYLEILNIQL